MRAKQALHKFWMYFRQILHDCAKRRWFLIQDILLSVLNVNELIFLQILCKIWVMMMQDKGLKIWVMMMQDMGDDAS